MKKKQKKKNILLIFQLYNINASGSKLYMNLKENNFCICKKQNLFSSQHYYPIKRHQLSENMLGVPTLFDSWDMFT